MMHYRIGQSYPIEGRGIFAERLECGPRWFIFRVPPMKERAAAAWLMSNGALEAWYPTTTDWVPAKGSNPRRRKVPYERRVAPGYLFVCVDRVPRWYTLFEAARGRLSRVVTMGGLPFAIPDEVIGHMKLVPRRIQHLNDKAEAEQYAAWLAKQPVEGGLATVKTGPLTGVMVEVASIHGGLAQCIAWGFSKVTIEAGNLERGE